MTARWIAPALAQALAASLLLGAPARGQDAPVESLLELPRADAPVWITDLDGDGRAELAAASERALHVWSMDADGRYDDERQWRLTWPSPDLGFDLADLDGDGLDEIVGLLGGTRLVRWTLGEEGFGEAETILDGLSGALPRGIHRVPLVDDIDANGVADVVVPGSGRFLILRGRGDGSLRDPFPVDYESDVEVEVGNPDRLDTEFGQDVEVPWFRMGDIDGDGHADLVSETRSQVVVHVADGDELPVEPTWSLDIAALEDEVALDGFDLFNLTRNFQTNVSWRIEDVDGQGALDLVIQQGNTLLVWLDGSRTGMDGKPDDVLPSSGNVLAMVLLDTVDDALPELHIIRIEDITLGKLVRMAVLTTDTTFEIFSYRNRGGRFERKTFQRRTIDLETPPLISLDDDDSEVAQGVEALRADLEDGLDYLRLSLDDDGRFDDAVAVTEGQLRFWRDAVPEPRFRGAAAGDELQGALADTLDGTDLDGIASFLRKQTGEVQAEKTYDVSLAELVDGMAGVARKFKPRPGSEPVFDHPAALDGAGLAVFDLDGDGISDVLLTGRDKGSSLTVSPRGTEVRDESVELGDDTPAETQSRVLQVLVLPAGLGAEGR